MEDALRAPLMLGPTFGSEIRKTRPCEVDSPDELNLHPRTAIIAPMTTNGHADDGLQPPAFLAVRERRG